MDKVKKYRVVNTDNHGGDYPDERFMSEAMPRDKAQQRADDLNVGVTDYSLRWHKVVEEDYVLQPGFEP